MKILVIHNYSRIWNEEDRLFDDYARLLDSQPGIELLTYTVRERSPTGLRRFFTAASTIWNWRTFRNIRWIVKNEKPDIVHLYNTFSSVSPSVFFAASSNKTPTILSLFNYRLLCPSATLFRSNRICELCLKNRLLVPAIRFKCHLRSRNMTIVAAKMILLHFFTWRFKVSRYAAFNGFIAEKHISAGYSSQKMAELPYHVSGGETEEGSKREGYLFVGRMGAEQGAVELCAWWNGERPALTLVGGGEYSGDRWKRSDGSVAENIFFAGEQPDEKIREAMRQARFFVSPSIGYGTLPLQAVEALRFGLPVICRNGGVLSRVIRHGYNGFHYSDETDFNALIDRLDSTPEERIRELRKNCRETYNNEYSKDAAARKILELYEETAVSRAV